MQEQATGAMREVSEIEHRAVLAEKEAKGRVGWRIDEEFLLGKCNVVVAAIKPRERQLAVLVKGNNTSPRVGAVYSAKGMDFKVLSRDQKTMGFLIEYVGKTKGMAAMMARIAANEAVA